jgi:hypothetical protein
VHLTSNATRVAAIKLMADLASGVIAGEPASKRARLESVIPTQAAPQARKTKAQTVVPPPTKPVTPPLWPQASCRLPSVAEVRAASQEASSEADGVALVREEGIAALEGPARPSPGAATRAAD